MHNLSQKHEFQYIEMMNMNLHLSLNKVILLFVLLNFVVISVSSALVIILSSLFNFNNSGVVGFFELSMVILLPIIGIISGFKIGNFYIFIYNIFAGLLNIHKIELNNQV
jgi:hypothetical protein